MGYVDKEHGYFTPAQSDLNWAQTFRMTGRAPVVANRIFDTLAHMEDYINDTSGKASATPGLLLVVISDSAFNNGVYRVLTVKETADCANGTYEKVGETKIVNQTASSVTIQPNVMNVWGTVSNLTISKGTDIAGIVNNYMIRFTAGNETVVIFNGIELKWYGGEAPTWVAGNTYEISIVDNIALWAEFEPVA